MTERIGKEPAARDFLHYEFLAKEIQEAKTKGDNNENYAVYNHRRRYLLPVKSVGRTAKEGRRQRAR